MDERTDEQLSQQFNLQQSFNRMFHLKDIQFCFFLEHII